jgi:hypothetical protein
MTIELTTPELKARLKALGLFGLIACWDQIADKPWLHDVLALEERERQKRGLDRRKRNARVGTFKTMADFGWRPKSAGGRRKWTAKPSTSSSPSRSSRLGTTACSSGPTASAKP